MSKVNDPIAVVISDIHFTLPTLELASQSLLKAQFKARMLDVPLIICGDTLDSKAIIRAEIAKKLMEMLSVKDAPKTYMIGGNHELWNEKGSEFSFLFLHGFCELITKPTNIELPGYIPALLIPYYSDLDKLKALLEHEDNPKLLFMHQGIQGAYMGHYTQDKTSLSKSHFSRYRVISGHYHRHQDIQCGEWKKNNIGMFSYVGNPYTLSFGEANDGSKGYQILHSDLSLEFVPLNLRKHIVKECSYGAVYSLDTGYLPGDLLWLKVHGPKSELLSLNKETIGKKLIGHSNFKLDLIQEDNFKLNGNEAKYRVLSTHDKFDHIIDNLSDPKEHKDYLKALWREVLNENS